MESFKIEVLAFQVRDGEYAVYKPLGDEEWYYLDADGRTWKTADAKTVLPEMEIAAPTVFSVNRVLTRSLATIANLQEHGGTAIVFVRHIRNEKIDGADIWSLTCCVVMTAKTGQPVLDAVKLFNRTLMSVPEVPAHLEIDAFTIEHLDRLDMVDGVHEL